jgi:hypothetical protein
VARDYAQHKQDAKRKKLLSSLLDWWLTRQDLAAYLPIILVTISMFIGSSWVIFVMQADPARYQCYALTFWFGNNATALLPANQCAFLQTLAPTLSSPLPFHMLPIEYPPLTLLPFSLPLLLPLVYYQWTFALIMSLVSLLAYWLLLRYGPRTSPLFFSIYMLLGALTTALARFDLIPATLTLMCIIAAERKHWRAAYVALAFGVLMKLYPILLLPPLFIAEQHSYGRLPSPDDFATIHSLQQKFRLILHTILQWRCKNCLLLITLLLLVTGAFALLNFQGAVVSQVDYFLKRPIQVESTSSTLLWLASKLGVPLSFSTAFGSINSVSVLSFPISSLGTLALVAGFLYVLWQQWHNKFDLAQSCVALLLLFIATGKVFSPQYLIWLIPLLAYVGAYDTLWFLLWCIIGLTTTLIFSIFYPVIDLSTVASLQATMLSLHGFFESIAMRNGLIDFITLAYLFNWFQARKRKPVANVPKGIVTDT